MSNVLCISTTLRDDGLVRDEQLLQREAFMHVQRVHVVLWHIVRVVHLSSAAASPWRRWMVVQLRRDTPTVTHTV